MLEHPNVISYFDSFEEDGILMIEMDYADGGTLAEYLSKRQVEQLIEERTILDMFQQMVAAIRHIHSHNILHRYSVCGAQRTTHVQCVLRITYYTGTVCAAHNVLRMYSVCCVYILHRYSVWCTTYYTGTVCVV